MKRNALYPGTFDPITYGHIDLIKKALKIVDTVIVAISENSNKISIVLERHENRLEESDRSDKLIIKMIEEMKDQEEKNHNILHERIDRIQKKVDANQKFRLLLNGFTNTEYPAVYTCSFNPNDEQYFAKVLKGAQQELFSRGYDMTCFFNDVFRKLHAGILRRDIGSVENATRN